MTVLVEAIVSLFDGLFARVQSFTGVTGMAYIFVAPNMIVFSVFVLFPMVFNFFYTFTGSDKLFLDQRPYVGAANLERLFDCDDFLRPATCDEDLFASAVLNSARFVVTQVAVMIAVSLLTAVVLNGRIRARGFFPQRFLLSGAALADCGGNDLAVDAAREWFVQCSRGWNGRGKTSLSDRSQLGALLGGDGERLVLDGLLYAYSASGLAGDSRRSLRSRCH